jgi:hypothetical protein
MFFANRYFKVINIESKSSLQELRVASRAGKKLAEVVLQQLKVLPGKGMAKEFKQWFGFFKKDKKLADEEAEYRPTEQKMYGDWELKRLADLGTSALKEILLGCRIDMDCDDNLPNIKPWMKGAEPQRLEKKRLRGGCQLLKREEVLKAVRPPRSYNSWKRRETMKIRIEDRLCILAVGDGESNSQTMPILKGVQDRLLWVTSAGEAFDPDASLVHLVIYLVHRGYASMVKTDGRPSGEDLKKGLELVEGLLTLDECLGVILVPGGETMGLMPAGLEVMSKRFAAFVPCVERVRHSGI